MEDAYYSRALKDAYNRALDKIEYTSDEPTFHDGWNAAVEYLRDRLSEIELFGEKVMVVRDSGFSCQRCAMLNICKDYLKGHNSKPCTSREGYNLRHFVCIEDKDRKI